MNIHFMEMNNFQILSLMVQSKQFAIRFFLFTSNNFSLFSQIESIKIWIIIQFVINLFKYLHGNYGLELFPISTTELNFFMVTFSSIISATPFSIIYLSFFRVIHSFCNTYKRIDYWLIFHLLIILIHKL